MKKLKFNKDESVVVVDSRYSTNPHSACKMFIRDGKINEYKEEEVYVSFFKNIIDVGNGYVEILPKKLLFNKCSNPLVKVFHTDNIKQINSFIEKQFVNAELEVESEVNEKIAEFHSKIESLKNEIKLYKNQKTLTPKGEGLKKAKKVFETFKNNYKKRKNEV